MELQTGQTDKDSLYRFGEEAISLLSSRNFQGMADRFGYALAYGRNVASAIEADFYRCLAEFNESPRPTSVPGNSVKVSYFKPHDSSLYAVVECRFIVSEIYPINADLIVTTAGDETHITLEDINLG